MKIKTVAAAGAIGLGVGFAGFIGAATAIGGAHGLSVRSLRR